MRIAIEAQRIFRPNKHGMDFVALETVRQLQRLDIENEYFVFVAPGEDRCLSSSANVEVVEVRCPSYPLWEQTALPMAVRRVKPDLLHCTANTAPLVPVAPLVLTLHDIIFLEKRAGNNPSLYQNLGWHYRRAVVPRVLPRCERIVTVSDYERGRIREALGLPEEKVVTVHNGYGSRFRPVSRYREVARKYVPEDEYLFFLGNTDPKKNTPRVLTAYARYLERSARKLPLLVADLDGEQLDRLLEAEGIEAIRPHLRCPGYIPNGDLPSVYSGAFAFLYPSLRESFGIPMLEAMACGTPVVASRTSAMPEVAGEGALLVDPENADEIAERLLRLESDDALYREQREYGLERVKGFSWEKSARRLLEIYREVAAGHGKH